MTDASFALAYIVGAVLPGDARAPEVWGRPSSCGLSRPRCGPGAGGQQHSQAPLHRSSPCLVPRASRQLWAAQPSPIPGGGKKCDISKWDIKV